MNDPTYQALLLTLQVLTITTLIALGGLSSCLSLWLIPLTTRLPPHLSILQFTQTYTWGGQYLQPTSRMLAASLLLISFLTSRLPDPDQAQHWKSWAGLLAFLAPVAVWEEVFIFPINRRVERIGREVTGGMRKGGDADVEREVGVLLGRWRRRNYVRVAMPILTGMGGMIVLVCAK